MAQDDVTTFQRTPAQKGVATSTDVVAIALPASALVGTLVMQDWKGLLQGVETAAVTAAATLILKYSVKEWRPDHSDRHSFPSFRGSRLCPLLLRGVGEMFLQKTLLV